MPTLDDYQSPAWMQQMARAARAQDMLREAQRPHRVQTRAGRIKIALSAGYGDDEVDEAIGLLRGLRDQRAAHAARGRTAP